MNDNKITLDLLQSIAFLRFASIYIAKWIVQIYGLGEESRDVPNIAQRNNKFNEIIYSFREIYLIRKFRDLRVFFIKIMYNKLGSDCINLLISDKELEWIVPEEIIYTINQVPYGLL